MDSSPVSNKSSVPLPLTALLVLIVLVGGFFYFFKSEIIKQTLSPHVAKIQLSLFEPGKLFEIFTVDPSTKSVIKSIPSGDTDTDAYLTSSLSPDTSKIAYIAVHFSGSVYDSPNPTPGRPSLVIADLDGNNQQIIDLPLDVKVARLPQWSPDGRSIVFQGKTSYGDSTIPEEWNVYLYNVNTGKVALVTSGANPLYSPDGHIIAQKNNGYYWCAQSANSNFEGKPFILTYGQVPSTANRLAISSNSSLVALAFPSISKVSLFKVQGLNPINIVDQSQLAMTATWPVFSPDTSQLAMLGISKDDSHLHMYIIDMASKNTTVDLPLSKYDPNAYLTDWR